MRAPLIGVTSSYKAPEDGIFGEIVAGESYIRAVLTAGGLPVVIPIGIAAEDLPALFARLDGILFTGGGDMALHYFEGQPHPRVYGIDERRDALEVALARMAVEQGKPFFGICRGLQVINVALGGSLFTDIADQLPGGLRHDYFPNIPRDHLAHTVTLESHSRLAQILGATELEVNSLHHQGVKRVAASLQVSATAPDHLVEALEMPGHPFGIAVQWHPEWLQEHAAQRALFHAFVQAAAA